MKNKLLLIILDGVPYRNFRRLFGNLEGWVDSGEARVWTQRAVLPSISASCYASIHTGVAPAEHGCTGNGNVFRLKHKDVFAQTRAAGGVVCSTTPMSMMFSFSRDPRSCPARTAITATGQRVSGKPRSTSLVAGSGQRLVTTLPRV